MARRDEALVADNDERPLGRSFYKVKCLDHSITFVNWGFSCLRRSSPHPNIRQHAGYTLRNITSGKTSPLEALKDWHNEYFDIKVDPSNIRNISLVSKVP